jgi:zinc transport system substrate-binding protein
MNRFFQSLVLVLFVLLPLGCSEKPSDTLADHELEAVIRTTFYPMTYMAKRLVGDAVAVESPLPPDADPIFYEPDDQALLQFRRAKLVASNGAEFERWMATASLPKSRVVETAAGLPGGFLTIGSGTHTHGGSTHSHEGTDGHTWVDPHNAIFQAEALAAAAARAFPEQKEAILARLPALKGDLLALDAELVRITGILGDTRLLASHPAYRYLKRRYGFEITDFDLDPEGGLKDHEKMLLRKASTTAPRTVLMWESEPLPETRRFLEEELKIKCVLFSPVESPPSEGDYMSVMSANLKRLADALQ